MSQHLLIRGDSRRIPLADGSVDAVICDPPYPEIDRPYGRMTEAEWHAMMRQAIAETRRILTPRGSAVFILQANSEHVGRMRTWLWEFMVWAGKEWNIVQDVYWWNFTAPPTVHAHRTHGLMKPSVKACVWLGPADCFRCQDSVLWFASRASDAQDRSDRALRRRPSGLTIRAGRAVATMDERGGSTPFNLLPVATADSQNSAGARGHGAGTPLELCDWWVRYLSRSGMLVSDIFMGSGTVGVAALHRRRRFVGIEIDRRYLSIAARRIERPHAVISRPGRSEYHPLFPE